FCPANRTDSPTPHLHPTPPHGCGGILIWRTAGTPTQDPDRARPLPGGAAISRPPGATMAPGPGIVRRGSQRPVPDANFPGPPALTCGRPHLPRPAPESPPNPPPRPGPGEPGYLIPIYPPGPETGTRYPLGEDPVFIGRGDDCAVRNQEVSVSRHHAQIA